MDKVDVLMHISGHGESELCEWANDNLQELAWTECKRKMPPEKMRVLCLVKHRGIRILLRHVAGPDAYSPCEDWQGESVSSIIQRFRLDDVTHWMPLPKLPEGWGQIATTPNVKVTGSPALSASPRGLPG